LSRGDRTSAIQQAESRKYLTKAQDFLDAARLAMRESLWNSAGLTAVHAGISAADSATVASAGTRSASKDHGAAVDLLRTVVPEASATQQRQLSGLLSVKNTVEYEQRLVTEPEARSMVEQASRLVKWATAVVTAHLD
jgi:hypothetical protein